MAQPPPIRRIINPPIIPENLINPPAYKATGGGESSGAIDKSGAHYQPGDIDKHFRVAHGDWLSFWFETEPVLREWMTEKFKFILPVREIETGNILYLPYHEDCITSIIIPTTLHRSVSYFVTTAMSGCNFFIDEGRNGDLVCYHANAKRYSPPAEARKENPAAISERAEEAMEAQHARAQESECREVARQRRLQVSEYYATVKDEVKYERESRGRKGVDIWGGSTVMGFRNNDNQWEFWFQTYGRITCSRVGINAAPFKVFKAKRIWPES